jgi:CubicO group peptidase (beta-lactamase class C family)
MPETKTINHNTLPVRGYGYLWWLLKLNTENVYAALGHGGQILLVSPQRELVVLMTSRWPSVSSVLHYRHLTRILVDRVLPLFPLQH